MEVQSLKKLVGLYHENKISHAYLLETNNCDKCFNELQQVVLQIFCNDDYCENCQKCNICNLVKQNYLPSFVVIEPSGSTIKKEQILELKRNFSSIPIYTKENIYVIKNAEKLTDSSANTMLKFVEEPEDNIIGFFITNNANNIISTIRSRCEIIKVMYNENELCIDNINSELNKKYLEISLEYLKKIEVEKEDMIMYNRSVLLDKLSEREDIKKVFQICLIIYEEALKKKFKLPNKFDNEISNCGFLLNLSASSLIIRVNMLTNFLNDLTSNANLELLIDKFVIELSDVYD